MKYRRFLIFALLLMFTAVLIGAFGSHAWKSLLMENGRFDIFSTANRYHFYHGLGILLVICLADRVDHSKIIKNSLLLLSTGVVLFSGSLYILALINVTWFGLVTPIGGLSLLLGWGLLSLGIYSSKQSH